MTKYYQYICTGSIVIVKLHWPGLKISGDRYGNNIIRCHPHSSVAQVIRATVEGYDICTD